MSTIRDVTALLNLNAFALVVSISIATTACGSHEDATPATSAGTSGGSSQAGHGGSGGNAGASGASGSAGTASPQIMCGTMQCSAPAAGLSKLAGGLAIPNIPVPIACCVDAASGPACGTAPSPTGTCELRAVADARCMGIDPGALSAFSGGTIAGCCTDQGACGVDGALFGRGCIENSDAAAELGMIPLLGPSITVPPPGPCSPDAGVSSEDGGI